MATNQSLLNGGVQGVVWPTAVGAEINFLGVLRAMGLYACDDPIRRLVVGHIVGPITILSSSGIEVTYSAEHLTALNGVVDGQWKILMAISSTGVASTSYNILWIQ